MQRIGIFGGSFNPVHRAHLKLAAEARKKLRLDTVLFVPCMRSAYGKKLLPAKARLHMLKLALKGKRGFEASDVEIKMGGVSRSIDTLKKLMAQYGEGAKFFLLIGADQAVEFPKWKSAERLSRLSQVCVMARPGFRKDPLAHKKFHFRTVKVSQYEISSTEIRHLLKKKVSVSHLVSPKILKFLQSNRTQI